MGPPGSPFLDYGGRPSEETDIVRYYPHHFHFCVLEVSNGGRFLFKKEYEQGRQPRA